MGRAISPPIQKKERKKMENMILKGYGFCWGRKMLLHSTTATRKSTNLYKTFLDKMCEIRGIINKADSYTKGNFDALRYGLTQVEVYDCGIYYSVRFKNGQANYPKTDCSELVFF